MPHRRPTFHVPPPPDGAPARAPGDPPRGGVRLPCPDPEGPEQYLSSWCEHRRLTLLKDKQIEWRDRASQATSDSQHAYAAARARSLRTPLTPRLQRCGTTMFAVRCGAPGKAPVLVARGCRQWWVCRGCRRRRSNSLRRRITDGLDRAWRDATAGGVRRGLRLLTLTVRHSGDLDGDRRALADGWRGFYKRLREWLCPRPTTRGVPRARCPYVAVWEVTPGRDGLGHPHLHVAVVWPRWLDYGRVRSLWLASCPNSERISIVGGSNGTAGCANYLAKYISKGVELSGFSDELRASVLASFYNAHLVLTSHRFWGPKVCNCCGQPWRRVLCSWDDVLGRHRGAAEQGGVPDPYPGPGDSGGVPGEQRALALPSCLRLVLDRG